MISRNISLGNLSLLIMINSLKPFKMEAVGKQGEGIWEPKPISGTPKVHLEIATAGASHLHNLIS